MTLAITFKGNSPLSRPMSSAFLGWASQIQFEAYHLLKDRDASWLNGVADQIRAVLALAPGTEDDWQKLLLEPNPSRTADTPFPFLVSEQGQLGLFAAREPYHAWKGSKPKTMQWERYAVFAALSIAKAFELIDAAENDSGTSALLHEAAGLAIEAVRALQIAHSLKAGAQQRTSSASSAARARHAKTQPYKNRAIANTLARPFPSLVKAVEYLTENEPIDEDGKVFASTRSAEDWLRKAGFKPTKKNAAPK